MTVRSWIEGSLRAIGVLAMGESVDANIGAACLQIASDMLDAWATERLLIYGQSVNSFALANGTQRYTWGSGGTWNGTRPTGPNAIDRVTYVTSAGLEIPIAVYTDQEWDDVEIKSTQSATPSGIYVNWTHPLAAVDVYPVPTDATIQIRIYARVAPIRSVASLNTTITTPEGWAEALKYNLALRLAIEFPPAGGLDGSIVAMAADSKAAIKRLNDPDEEMEIDPALTTRSVGSALNNYDDF